MFDPYHLEVRAAQIQIPVRATLFVGDLSYFCNEAHLKSLFSPFGRILNIELKRGKFGDSLMHAFLDFDQPESARRSIQELHGIKFMGRIMRVNWASAQAAKENQRQRDLWTQVHVAFSTPNLQLVVTEETLEDIFGRFGALADVTVKRYSRTVDPPSHAGYAFLYFFEYNAAVAASQSFASPVLLRDLRLQCTLTTKSRPPLSSAALAVSAAKPLHLMHPLAATPHQHHHHQQQQQQQQQSMSYMHHNMSVPASVSAVSQHQLQQRQSLSSAQSISATLSSSPSSSFSFGSSGASSAARSRNGSFGPATASAADAAKHAQTQSSLGLWDWDALSLRLERDDDDRLGYDFAQLQQQQQFQHQQQSYSSSLGLGLGLSGSGAAGSMLGGFF